MKFMQHFVPTGEWRARAARGFAAALLASVALSAAAMAAGLNDTGFTTCADAAGAVVSCTAASAVQGQDARYGRDAAAGTSALTKVGGGANGFDFTKISNAGAVLPATAPLGTAAGEWGCTYDNTTGLMWEVKTISGLRGSLHTYSWYNSNASANGGQSGVSSAGTCFAPGRCDTEKFIQDVNANSMCAHSDWRLPSVGELLGLVRLGSVPTIDGAYFPNTSTFIGSSGSGMYMYWSSAPNQRSTNSSWLVSFVVGGARVSDDRSAVGFGYAPVVRLVRGGR